jgi:hypothetical protein
MGVSFTTDELNERRLGQITRPHEELHTLVEPLLIIQ